MKGDVLNITGDVLAAAAFIGAWVYCYRQDIGPIELAGRLIERVRKWRT